MLAGAAVFTLLAAAPAFAAGSNGGEPFIDPNTAPPGFYTNDPGQDAWGPHVSFVFHTGNAATASQGNHQSEAPVFARAPNNGLG
jgi:hypothetical protein